VEQVTYYTKAGGGCGQCHPKIEALIERVRKEMEKETPPAKPEKKKLTNIQKIKLIEETLGREIIPALKADGGDLDLIDVEGSKVFVALRGKCSFCPSSEFTLKQYVELKLREFVSDDIEVEEVRP
jgi:NifU-like protein